MNLLTHSLLAFTPPSGGQGGGDPLTSMLPTFLFFGAMIFIFYFMILRPQKKRQQEHQKLLDGMKKGDKVITASGIHGTISEVDNGVILLQVADNVRIRVEKSAITTVEQK